MAHLISPIEIDGVPRCCDPATKRTEEVLSGAAQLLAADEWEIFRAQAGGDPTSNPEAESGGTVDGKVTFGICCASQATIEVWGNIETLNTGFDWLEVRLNGAQEFYFESTETSEDPWETVAVGPFTVNLTLQDRACGHIIEIEGSTGDEVANNDVWWKAKVVSIS